MYVVAVFKMLWYKMVVIGAIVLPWPDPKVSKKVSFLVRGLVTG